MLDNVNGRTETSARSNTALAVTELRRLIFSGELAPGTDHLESELAQMMNMSRTPVREALLRLEAQGLLQVRPRKGARITPLSKTDIGEIYDILADLESCAAANAAENNLDENATRILTQAIAEMESSLGCNDRETWIQADETFHTELVRLGGNSRIINIAGIMSDQVRRARLVTLYMRPAPTQSNEDHKAVVDAIQTGDADQARRLHRQHRLSAKNLLTETLERHKLSSI